VPLELPLEELRSYALNIEETKVNEVKNSNSTETKDNSNNNNHPPSQNNGKRNGKGKFKKGKKNGQVNDASSILDGQAKPICYFCGNIGHVENTCRAKERAMKEAKQYTNDKAQKWKKDKLEKYQSFATATAKSAPVSACKNNDSDDDKFDNHYFMNASIKSYDKSQNKSAGKGKRKRIDSDSESGDSHANYSNSYKLVALKP
jgi:hypothetical protein